MRPGDEVRFRGFAEDVFDFEVDGAGAAEYLRAPGHLFIVAAIDEMIVGQCACVIHRHFDQRPTELYIDDVGVAPEFRRMGIATRMLDLAFSIGRQEGCREAWVGTEHDNVPACSMYKARGSTAEAFVLFVYDLMFDGERGPLVPEV
jgi:aminoglycoside 6'-N-acetyltransferase I